MPRYRCARGHGRLTPFVRFLREKEFIRPPAPAGLARLRATIRTVSCSSCGAPVDLQRDSACPHSRAPIAILDADALTATVRAAVDLVALGLAAIGTLLGR